MWYFSGHQALNGWIGGCNKNSDVDNSYYNDSNNNNNAIGSQTFTVTIISVN